jgi:signal transduction histidine kinase
VRDPDSLSERALILAPHGRDGQIAARILDNSGFPADTCADLSELCRELESGAGLAIVADHALFGADLSSLRDHLRSQPSWSDLSIILLTPRGDGSEREAISTQLSELLGNVSFLERPLHPSSLIGAVRTALRGRRRQYEARARMRELAEERAALAKLTETLEERVEDRTIALEAESAARARAQEQLLQSQKMESIGQLTGGVAHDFNNLLMAVTANLELLGKRCGDDERARRLISGALEGAKRGTSLTQRMLAFARRQELKTTSADLGALLRGMADLLERALGPQIDLTFEIAANLPPAKVDANQIELAILNLAINARDSMPDGGKISITVDRARAVGVNALREGEYLRLQLSDTGCGMDEATLKRAIEPFFSTKPLGKGTGLGLSMIHGLAVQLGGRLQLKSVVGQGTTAILWMPIADADALPVAPAPSAPSQQPSRAAIILVVDDDPLVAMSTVDMLEDLGHTVIEANSADQALKILEDGRSVDLMLTDHVMPGMTGVELAHIARSKRPAMPVLLATGYTDLPAGQKIDLPRLSKPYLQNELQEQIDRLLHAAAE